MRAALRRRRRSMQLLYQSNTSTSRRCHENVAICHLSSGRRLDTAACIVVLISRLHSFATHDGSAIDGHSLSLEHCGSIPVESRSACSPCPAPIALRNCRCCYREPGPCAATFDPALEIGNWEREVEFLLYRARRPFKLTC